MSGQEKSLKITNVEGPSDKGWFTVHTQDGKKYGTKNAGIKNFVGIEASFQVNSMTNKFGKESNYINDPLPEVPRFADSSVPEKKGFNSDSMYVSYAKDLVIARLNFGQQQDMSNSALVRDVLSIADDLINGRKAANDTDDIPPF